MVVSALLLVGTVYLFTHRARWGSSRAWTPASCSGQIEALQGIGFEAMVAQHQKQVMDILAEGSERRRRTPSNVGGNGGRLNVDLKPRDQRDADGRPDHRGAAAEAGAHPGRPRLPARTRRRSASAACSRAASTSSRCRIPTPRSSTASAPQFEAALRDVPGLAGRHVRPADQATRRSTSTLDRDQIAALGLTVDQVESALTSAYGTRQVSQIFAPDDQYQVIMQVAPQYQRDPAALSMLYVQAPGGKLVPLSAVVTTRQTVGPAVGQPHRPAAVGDAVVQPAARASRSATRVARVQAARARRRCRRRSSGSFQGTAQAFQDSMQRPRLDSRARDLRHLRRARHPLRELHPPADDSLRACRRPASARC